MTTAAPVTDAFTALSPSATEVADPCGVGVFIRVTAPAPSSRIAVGVGAPRVVKWAACYRNEPFWMVPKAGREVKDVPPETQFLAGELPDGQVAIFVPILDGAFRCSLEGNAAGELALVAESGDKAVITDQAVGLFVAVGEDVFDLCRRGAEAVQARMKTGRLRRDKKLPSFVDKFGWCTWDAFYQEVSHEKVREGLESFKKGGVSPKLLILDDGWQSVGEKLPHSAPRLAGFAANAKFPGDLAPTVAMAKQEFGVEHFLVWHAFQGYWGGVDPAAFPTYDVRPLARDFGQGILQHMPVANEKWWGSVAGVVPSRDIYGFYQAYHRHLRLQGVDGVKVDNQSTTEGLAAGEGGRVRVLRKYHEALEGSVHVHFDGALINCMSCGNDILYQTMNSTLTRTSTDFWPTRPETHGLHLYTNAQVCLWFGEFVHADWDMFQSGHEWGAFHAAGRAVSGSPVYVSDKPGQHNFELLRKLMRSDGTVLRCPEPGRPTRDCLFADPTKEDVLLKIWNRNRNNAVTSTAVIGVFNCRYHAEPAERKPVKGSVGPADIPGLAAGDYAVYFHRSGRLEKVAATGRIEVELPEGGWEAVTITAVENGFAAVGLANKLNAAAALHNYRGREEGSRLRASAQTAEGGDFVAYCARKPHAVRAFADGIELKDVPFEWKDGLLRADTRIGPGWVHVFVMGEED